jgi:hypothetical protein
MHLADSSGVDALLRVPCERVLHAAHGIHSQVLIEDPAVRSRLFEPHLDTCHLFAVQC